MTPAFFDAHLDLAMNHLRGRDVTRPARGQPVVEKEIATVGLPDLRAGGVTRLCATIFCQPKTAEHPGYTTPQEAHEQALAQLNVYDRWHADGEISIASPARLADTSAGAAAPQAIILLEGAECVRTPADVAYFVQRGVRIVGLAWQATRYAGGTATPGPLTDLGRELVRELDRFGVIHDASHLAERSFWDLLEVASGPIIASHSNCRAIVAADPYERHLSDDMIRAIVQRGGVVGINFFDRFLLPASEYKTRRATLADVVRHVQRVCEIAGDADHVAIGTDMDGGLGREQIPVEIETSADLPKLRPALREAGLAEADVEKVCYGNWSRVLV